MASNTSGFHVVVALLAVLASGLAAHSTEVGVSVLAVLLGGIAALIAGRNLPVIVLLIFTVDPANLGLASEGTVSLALKATTLVLVAIAVLAGAYVRIAALLPVLALSIL